MSWETELTPDLLPNELTQRIAAEIGADNLLKLVRLLDGKMCYLPKEKAVLRKLRYKKINEEYNGQNEMALARKYNYSKRRIQTIIKQKLGGKVK